MIEGTALSWTEALTDNYAWNQGRDTSRIRKAFVILMQTRESWPAPKHFREALPASSQLQIAGNGERPYDPPELLAAMAAGGATSIEPMAVTRAERTSASALAAVEADLRKNYADHRDRKTAAAGGDA